MSTEADIVEMLRDRSLELSGRSIDRGCQDSGISANLCDKAVDLITQLRAERDAAARDMPAFMKELSDALLEVRPLGGSEMFTKRFGNYYADPVYCRTVIKHLHETLHEARKDVARLRKSSRALLATDGDNG